MGIKRNHAEFENINETISIIPNDVYSVNNKTGRMRGLFIC